MSTPEGVQYSGGYHEYTGGYHDEYGIEGWVTTMF